MCCVLAIHMLPPRLKANYFSVGLGASLLCLCCVATFCLSFIYGKVRTHYGWKYSPLLHLHQHLILATKGPLNKLLTCPHPSSPPRHWPFLRPKQNESQYIVVANVYPRGHGV